MQCSTENPPAVKHGGFLLAESDLTRFFACAINTSDSLDKETFGQCKRPPAMGKLHFLQGNFFMSKTTNIILEYKSIRVLEYKSNRHLYSLAFATNKMPSDVSSGLASLSASPMALPQWLCQKEKRFISTETLGALQ